MTDPAGASIPRAEIQLRNPLTGFRLTAETDPAGVARLTNIPYNRYHLEIRAAGFAAATLHPDVRSAVPLTLKIQLNLASAQTTVDVEASADDLLENVAYAHTDL
ncbi:MAG: carboxypeptidase-like regulatory domain-containing protein, partial [Bryobacteraceae bacterium]|nr:carboxypeptidase-like regulatory domain-containing protein [Bryobacteraceae bacterium]